MLGDAMSGNAMLGEELEGLAPGECWTAWPFILPVAAEAPVLVDAY